MNSAKILCCIFIAIGLINTSCDARDNQDHVDLQGANFTYAIPHKYLKSPDSILYPGEINGDPANVVSLLITNENWPISETNGSDELFLLLYIDKIYTSRESLRKLSLSYLNESEISREEEGFIESFEKLGETEYRYFFSFDPRNAKETIDDTDFIAQKILGKSLAIGQIERMGRARCSLHGVHDGIRYQASTAGTICDNERFSALQSIVIRVMNSWAESDRPE